MNKPLPLNYIRQLIIKTACDTTGDDIKAVIEAGRLEIPPRDAIELMVRLQAAFDCVVGRLRYEPLSVDIDELAGAVLAALAAKADPANSAPTHPLPFDE